jgi:hypothetical protein
MWLVLMGLAPVAPAALARALPCVPGTLARYIALGATGCTAGTVTFANFAYTAKGNVPHMPPSQIQVSTTFAIPSTAVLSFSAMWGVSLAQGQTSIIQYTVAGHATSSGELTLELGMHQAGEGGSIVVAETANAGNLQVYEKCEANCRSVTSAVLPFMPTTAALQVTDNVTLSSGNGDFSLSSFTASFNLCAPCI